MFLLPAFLVGLIGVTLAQNQAGRTAFRSPYSTIEGASLVQEALALQREGEELKRQLTSVRAQLDALQADATRTSGAARELQEQLVGLRVEAGLTPRSGPGVYVTLDDARLPPTRDSRLVAPAIVHSQDLTDIINAGWKGGALAIAVNNERVTSASACVGATIQINGTLLSPPFVVAMVGPPEQLLRVLTAPEELIDLRSRQRAFGLRFEVTAASAVLAPAYTGALGIRFAQAP